MSATKYVVTFVRNTRRKQLRWEDGTATVSENGKKLTLHDDNGQKVDIAMISSPILVGSEITTEKQYMINVEECVSKSPKRVESTASTTYATPAIPERKIAPRARALRGSRNSFRPPIMDRSEEDPSKNTYKRAIYVNHRPDPPVKRPILGLSHSRPKRRTNDDILHLLGRGSKCNATAGEDIQDCSDNGVLQSHADSNMKVDINGASKQKMLKHNLSAFGTFETSQPKHTQEFHHDQSLIYMSQRNGGTDGEPPKMSYSIFMEDEEDTISQLDVSNHAHKSRSAAIQNVQFPDSTLLSSTNVFKQEHEISGSMPLSRCDNNLIGILHSPQQSLHKENRSNKGAVPDTSAITSSVPYSSANNFQAKETGRAPSIHERGLQRRAFVAPKSSGKATSFNAGRLNTNCQVMFPPAPPVDAPEKKRQKREAMIPDRFSTCRSYQTSLLNALLEQLNLQLDELSTEYHRTKTSIDLSAYNLESSSKTSTSAAPHCSHGPTKLCTVQKDGKNKGRHFYACPKPKGQGCNFFLWADQQQRSKSFPMNDTRVKVTTANELEQVFRAGGICFFADCYLQRSKRNWHARHESASSESKTVFLSLDRCSRGMAFAKRDLWVVSTSVNFDSEQTAVLESVFFGPSSEGSIELKPITAKSAGILKSNVPLYAIKAFNAATELKCVENLTKGIKELPSLPILQTLLGKQNDPRGPHPLLGKTAVPFVAVLVLLVCELFSLSEKEESGSNGDEDVVRNEKQQNRSILISSGTNVAVDRILQSLLDMGMSDFVRVGSARKIAPTVLPYSTHGSSSSDNKGIKDLKQMLSEDGISLKEKKCIRDSIERMKQGVNMQLLKSTRVVAATLAATEFQCMQGLSFPFVILDEACQMTEPNALLPIARFNCQNLVLVGDPKQLSPAIPGAEAEHSHGLEQSMFQRLMKSMPPTAYKMLGIQYRCHPTISAMANRLTYGGKLRDGISQADRKALVNGLPPLCFFDCDFGTEERQGGGSYINVAEAQFIVFVIESLLRSETVEPCEIGVISTYKAQAKHIHDLLKASDQGGCNLVISSTVDAFQGGEREVVLLSCVRTSGVGFIDDPDRTNVALTRSKRHLFIVGRQHTLWRNKLWHGVLNYCFHCDGGKSDVQQGRSTLLDLLEDHTRKKTAQPENTSPSAASDYSPVGPTAARTVSALDDEQFLGSTHKRSTNATGFSPPRETQLRTSNLPDSNGLSLHLYDLLDSCDDESLVGDSGDVGACGTEDQNSPYQATERQHKRVRLVKSVSPFAVQENSEGDVQHQEQSPGTCRGNEAVSVSKLLGKQSVSSSPSRSHSGKIAARSTVRASTHREMRVPKRLSVAEELWASSQDSDADSDSLPTPPTVSSNTHHHSDYK
eukprot:m.854889 g.854889  ORF g.854889 m.854889 type:complete len:1374 (+) comp23504_c0_seq30:183-4304(+)